MTELHDGDTIGVSLPSGQVAVQVGEAAMGPPGLRGQRGERGDPGGTTTVVYAFGEIRTPDALPGDGLIPADWDGEGRPLADLQVGVGQSVKYLPDGYLWTFVGPASVPGSWIETGPMAGPPGDAGPVGARGPEGPRGERGEAGARGEIGLPGPQGDTGPQGARGLDGAAGPPGATGVPGPVGPPGRDGLDGDDGADGPEGPRGERGEDGQDGLPGEPGEPGAPSFITGMLATRTGSELASAAPTGLIPANFDGIGRPPADHQMSPGEAWLATVAADPLRGQAIVYVGQTILSAPWIPMTVTGPQGDQGPTGAQGPAGATGPAGADGADGARWWWSTDSPPSPGMGTPGDWALVMIPGNPDVPEHGGVYQKLPSNAWSPTGNIRGPRGLQGVPGPEGPMGPGVPPAEFAELIQRVDELTARVARLEATAVQTIGADVVIPQDEDRILQSIPVAPGDWIGSATLAVELRGSSANTRNVTAWFEPSGAGVTLTGHRAGQVTVHQALPLGQISVGPCRAVVTAPGNFVLHVKNTAADGTPTSGELVIKATSTVDGRPGASGFAGR